MALHALEAGTSPSWEQLQLEAVHAGRKQDKERMSQSVHCMATVPAHPTPGGEWQEQALSGPEAGTG